MSKSTVASLVACLPTTASVETVQLDSLGYDAHGKYYGRGARLFRLTDSEIQLDVCVRGSKRVAVETLLLCLMTYRVRFAYWLAQEASIRTPLMTACDWDTWVDRAAMRDVAACL